MAAVCEILGNTDSQTRQTTILKFRGTSVYKVYYDDSGAHELFTFKSIDASKCETLIQMKKCKIDRGSMIFELPRYGRPLTDIKITNDHDIIQMLLDVCSALVVLHSLGIIHRDIKRENVVTSRSRFVLIDFSHSLRKIDSHVSYSLSYTVTYRPPEVNCKEYCGIESDMFALGLLLLYALHNYDFTPDKYEEIIYDEVEWNTTIHKMLDEIPKYFEHRDIYKTWITNLLNFSYKDRMTSSTFLMEIKKMVDERHVIPEIYIQRKKLVLPTIELNEEQLTIIDTALCNKWCPSHMRKILELAFAYGVISKDNISDFIKFIYQDIFDANMSVEDYSINNDFAIKCQDWLPYIEF